MHSKGRGTLRRGGQAAGGQAGKLLVAGGGGGGDDGRAAEGRKESLSPGQESLGCRWGSEAQSTWLQSSAARLALQSLCAGPGQMNGNCLAQHSAQGRFWPRSASTRLAGEETW
jgi:hypothetical protein